MDNQKRAYEKSYVFWLVVIEMRVIIINSLKHKTYMIEEKNEIVKKYLNW